MNAKSLCVAAAVAALAPAGTHAAAMQVQSDIRDYEAIRTASTGALSISNGVDGDNRIGNRTATTMSSSILGFALPTLAAGETIDSATLTVRFKGESASLRVETGDGNVDLYGLGVDPAPEFTQDPNRYYSGPLDATAGATKLQENFFTLAEYPAEGTTLNKVSLDIGGYLQSLYAAGAEAGDFAVLRLSYDIEAHSGTNNRYRIVSSGGDAGTVDASPHTIEEGAPFLSITTVPEPGSLAILGLGALGLARRGRRTV